MEAESDFEPSILELAAWCTTLSASVLGCGLNAFLLLATVGQRCRRRGANGGRTNNGLLVLACAEIALNVTLALHLLLTQLGGPASLELAFHSMHVIRNWWLLALTACRTAAVLKPFSSGSAAGRSGGLCRLGCRWQIVAVVVIVAAGVGFVCVSETIVNSSFLTSGGDDGSNATVRELLQPGMVRFALMAAAGTLAPGFCIVALGTRTALALHRQAFHHQNLQRSCRMVLLLSLGFAVLEFPFVGLQLLTVGRVLAAEVVDQGPQMLLATLDRLVLPVAWSFAFVPVNSCLNFCVLLLCSRTFRANVCCCGSQEGAGAAAATAAAAAATAAARPVTAGTGLRCLNKRASSDTNAIGEGSQRCQATLLPSA